MPDRQIIKEKLRHLGQLAPGGYYVALHFRFAAPLTTYTTYSDDWIERYTAQAYAMRDPMTAWAFSTEGARRWSEIDMPDPFGIMAEAAEYGLRFGVQVSHGVLTSRSIAGVAREDREFTDDEIARIAQLVQDLHDLAEPPETLTLAQVEALRLVAEGERHTAAAARIGISESALKARLTSARQRLKARTTAEAIQRAKDARLL